MRYWKIAVHSPLWRTLTYENPQGLELHTGSVVYVPLGRQKKVIGVCLAPVSDESVPQNVEIKPIIEPAMEGWRIAPEELRWASWLSEEYVYPLGLILPLLLPAGRLAPSRAKKKSMQGLSLPSKPPIRLNELQQKILSNILSHATSYQVHYLHGVTGSGKTEIYIQLFKHVLDSGQQGLFLLPEISLTPQMIARFNQVFPQQLVVIHSGLTPAKRNEAWYKMQEGSPQILLGARSALFCPIPKLGLIVIDEEHDGSFKQETRLRYHTREAAIKLAEIKNIPLLLGSATPSLESYHAIKQGTFHYHHLPRPAATSETPEIHLISLRSPETFEAKHKIPKELTWLPRWLSPELYVQIKSSLSQNKQVALLLNRRGFSSFLLCESCGYVVKCPNCEISLTLHKGNALVCHYCGYQQDYTEACPACPDGTLKPLGLGTEQVEDVLQSSFQPFQTLRIDRDEVQNLEDLEIALERFARKESHILIGTQMIAKGLDFPDLQSVGLIYAEQGLHLPDFRSAERTMQLLLQMMGRAGRHARRPEERGQILIQTYQPEHPLFQFLLQRDYLGFVEQELELRRQWFYPPFSRLALIHLENTRLQKVDAEARAIRHWLEQGKTELLQRVRPKDDSCHTPLGARLDILGPAPAPILKIKNRFRYHILLKYSPGLPVSKLIRQILIHAQKHKISSTLHVDIDPQHLI